MPLLTPITKRIKKYISMRKQRNIMDAHLTDAINHWSDRLIDDSFLDAEPVRLAIDMNKYKQVKKACRLKNSGQYYSTFKDISKYLNVSTTTVCLINKSKNYKNYKALRRVK